MGGISSFFRVTITLFIVILLIIFAINIFIVVAVVGVCLFLGFKIIRWLEDKNIINSKPPNDSTMNEYDADNDVNNITIDADYKEIDE